MTFKLGRSMSLILHCEAELPTSSTIRGRAVVEVFLFGIVIVILDVWARKHVGYFV